MKTTAFLPRYGWRVEIFTEFECEKTNIVLDALEQIGCDEYHLWKARDSMMKCDKNTGLTYSNADYRTSVAVVYKTSSFREFINTLSHECAHICAHITRSFLIKLNEEEFCEMVGDLMAEMSDVILQEAKSF